MALLLARRDLAAHLRAWGLEVIEEPGWKTRGASGGKDLRDVRAVMWHHTATPRSRFRNDPYPTEQILRHGRPGLSGPLCQIGFDRLGRVHLEGAGKANHAGKGSFGRIPRDAGNTYSLGVEAESSGVAPADWTPQQLANAPVLGAALSSFFALDPHGDHCEHKQYSRTGKIDRFGWPGGIAGFREQVAAALKAGPRGKPLATAPVTAIAPWRTSKRVAGMTTDQVRRIQQVVGVTVDGIYGDKTGTAVAALQAVLELPSDGVWGPATEAAVSKLEDKIDRLIAFGEQIHWRVDTMPQRILDEPVDLEGAWKGQQSTLRRMRAWYAEDLRQIKEGVATSRAAILKAVQETAKAQGLTDDQVQAIASAAAEAAARVSAEDVAEHLEVTVSGTAGTEG